MTENANKLPNLLTPPVEAEPANQWASNTISALHSAEPTSHPTSAVTTPGAQFPGAYPPTPGNAQPTNGLSLNNVKDTAKEYLYTAEQYVPTQEDIKKAAQTASKVISSYVPEGFAGHLGPSSESRSDHGDITAPTDADDGKESTMGIKSKDMLGADTNDSAGQTPMAMPVRDATNEPPADNASTVTQPGSLLLGENQSKHIEPATPYSYTAITDHTQLPTQTAPTYGGDHHFSTDEMVDETAGEKGHPDGIVNHGEVEVYFGSGGKGAVVSHATEPGSDDLVKPGKSAVKGAGPGGSRLPVVSMSGEDDSGDLWKRLDGGIEKPAVEELNKNPTEEDKHPNERNIETTTNEAGLKGKNSDHDQGEKLSHKVNGLMDNDTVNTEPRKYPLSQEDAGRASDQNMVNRDEEHGSTIGKGAANGNTSQTPVSSKFKEETTTAERKGRPSEADASGVPRLASPMSSPVNPHANRAISGPNERKLKLSTELPQNTSQKKHGFLNKIKALSKKLSP